MKLICKLSFIQFFRQVNVTMKRTVIFAIHLILILFVSECSCLGIKPHKDKPSEPVSVTLSFTQEALKTNESAPTKCLITTNFPANSPTFVTTTINLKSEQIKLSLFDRLFPYPFELQHNKPNITVFLCNLSNP